MKRTLILFAALSLGLTVMAAAQDEPAAFDGSRAHVYQSFLSKSLTASSKAQPESVVVKFLGTHGIDAATLASLREVGRHAGQSGQTHIRMEQQIGGLRVLDAYVTATVNARGELVHLIENVAPAKRAAIASTKASEAQALKAALARLYPKLQTASAIIGLQDNVTTFDKGTFFYSSPTVERVTYLTASGVLKGGFLVQTWSKRTNLLHYTLVDQSGKVQSVELRTNTDKYNIFPISPTETPQTIVSGPGIGGLESPAGWIFGGPQGSVNISGNNVHAYVDRNADNDPDSFGTRVTNGQFLAAADLTTFPTTARNQNVAVQNLFYFNNVIHDTLYEHGFTEATGNFQQNNFGRGGRDGDPVNAEAQDGSGTDNANFATPVDGLNPRMQMYLWTGKGDHQVVINSGAAVGIYRAQGAVFGPPLDATGITGDVVLVNDGVGTVTDACEALAANSLTGKIALLDRGSCTFVVKVKNAQNAGAVAAVVANNAGDSIITMGGTDSTITIPSVFISKTDGTTIRGGLPANATVRLTDPPPLQRDGDIDSDIMWHEYGHGLTWRMIGKMSGPLSGAVGEGMSDVLAVIMNEDDRLGEYAFDDPLGIRRFPYTNYPRTYGSFGDIGFEVHSDGEIYGAIGWRMFQDFQNQGISKNILLDYIIDGMNFTPAGPSFEQMRDGILQSVANSGSGHECLIWDAFAHYGVGVGAVGKVKGKIVVVHQSFALPPECQ
jgi:extracellular elastinolytic metalloproteinase